MKTLLGTLLALGLLSGTASAQWCPPGYGYGQSTGYGQSYGYRAHRPTHSTAPVVIEKMPAPAPEAPAAPIEPAPVQPAPEEAPPK